MTAVSLSGNIAVSVVCHQYVNQKRNSNAFSNGADEIRSANVTAGHRFLVCGYGNIVVNMVTNTVYRRAVHGLAVTA